MASMLHNRLVDACVVIGMDEQTGLLPLPKIHSRSVADSEFESFAQGPFQTNVLSVLTGTEAFFPCQLSEVPAGKFYLESQVICPVAATSQPTGHGLGHRLRRSLSFAPKGMPFSDEVVQSLPPFCFPDGGFTYISPKEPYMHYLVLTNIDGGRSYGCGVIVTRRFVVKNLYQISGASDLELATEDSSGVIHVPLCICLVSKWQYFNAMKNMLSSLVPLLTDAKDIWPTLMKFASHVSSVVVPPAGELVVEIELLGQRISIPSADEPDHSVVDFDLHLPLFLLSIEDILKIIASILTEQRLIFICSNQALIPLVIECFFAFIEPFKWRRTYVPILPFQMVDLIEAPGPFIMGCHSRLRTHIKQVIGMEELPSILVVDLDERIVDTNPKESFENIPHHIAKALSLRLRKTKYQYDLELTQIPTLYNIEEASNHRQKFVADFARDLKTACLEMMASLFADVVLYMRVGERFFDRDGYLQSKPSQDYRFYLEACASDAFERFIDDRLENPSRRDTFFMLAEKVVGTSSSTLRNRNTSDIMPSNRKGAILSFAKKKSVFKQPAFLDEGLHTGSYFKQCIEKLTEEIVCMKSKKIALKASLLFLRGMLYIASKQPIEGLADFYALHSANQELFPASYVQQVIADLDAETERKLNKQEFFSRSATFRLFLKKTEEQQAERPTRKLPTAPVEREEFIQRVKAFFIAESAEAAGWLFQSLQYNGLVSEDRFAHLYNTFTKVERELKAIEIHGIKQDIADRAIACSPLVNTTKGMGRIVITVNQLHFIADGGRDSVLITRLRDIRELIKYQHYVVFPPGVAALRIVNRDRNIPPFFACLKEDRNVWVCLLHELNGGHESALALKEPKLIEQAANNVMLTTVLLQMDIVEHVVDGLCSFSRNRDSDRKKLSEQTRDALERWLDPCVREANKTTIMSVAYVQSRTTTESATIWCGLGSGAIMVYEVESWTCVSELRYAKNRISCLLPVGEQMVWAGSYDSVIYVIDTDTRKAEQQLQNHTDYISDIIYVEAGEENEAPDVVWSASFGGHIVKWDPETRESKKQITLPKVKTLTHLMLVKGLLWCASVDCLFVVDPGTGTVIKKLQNFAGHFSVPMECFSRVSDTQIWAFGKQKNELFIWNTTSYECKTIVIGDDVKASAILPIMDKVWVGCKDGKVFIINTSDFACVRELHAHMDAVKCMCLTEEGHVITGSSSLEGKLCVWNAFLPDRYDDASALGYDILDGSMKVMSKIRTRKYSCS